MPKKWFCKIDNDEVGPLDAARIKKLIVAGTLRAEHHIREANGNWRSVHAVPKLKELLDVIQASRDHEQPQESRPAYIAHEQYFPKFARIRLRMAIAAVLVAATVYVLRVIGVILEAPKPTMFMKRFWLIRAFFVGMAPALAAGGTYTAMTAFYILKAPKDWFTKSEHGKGWIDNCRFRRDNVAGFKLAAVAIGLFGLLFAVAGFGNACASFW